MYAAPTAAASVGVKKPPRMPPRMTTGAPSGAITRRPVDHTRAQLNSVLTMFSSRRTKKNTTTHSPTAISSGRHDRRREQGTGRDGRQPRIDDRRDARRHHRGDQGRRAHDAQREAFGVAAAQHRRDLDLAEGGGVRDGRAAHPGEAQAHADADVPEAAAHPAEQGEREVEEPVRDAGVVGQTAEQDEQGHRQQRKARGRLRHQAQGEAERLVVGREVEQRRADERERDRDPDHQQQGDQQAEEEQAHATGASTSS